MVSEHNLGTQNVTNRQFWKELFFKILRKNCSMISELLVTLFSVKICKTKLNIKNKRLLFFFWQNQPHPYYQRINPLFKCNLFIITRIILISNQKFHTQERTEFITIQLFDQTGVKFNGLWCFTYYAKILKGPEWEG